jgi:hypothetical protein
LSPPTAAHLIVRCSGHDFHSKAIEFFATIFSLIILTVLLSDVHGSDRVDSLITATSIGHVHLGATKAGIQQSWPHYQVADTEILMEAQQRSAAVQVQRAGEILVTAEISEAGRAWRITTEHPMFKTTRGAGVGTTFDALVRAHRKPNSFEFPEGALIALYRFPDGVIAFQLDRGFDDVFFKKASPPRTARVIRVVVVQQ